MIFYFFDEIKILLTSMKALYYKTSFFFELDDFLSLFVIMLIFNSSNQKIKLIKKLMSSYRVCFDVSKHHRQK
jgi:hypothetical protein